MKYKGYTYRVEEDMMDEFTTRFDHYAEDSSGTKIDLQYSGYRTMSKLAFETLVDLKFPDNPAGKLWNEDELVKFKSSMEGKLSEL